MQAPTGALYFSKRHMRSQIDASGAAEILSVPRPHCLLKYIAALYFFEILVVKSNERWKISHSCHCLGPRDVFFFLPGGTLSMQSGRRSRWGSTGRLRASCLCCWDAGLLCLIVVCCWDAGLCFIVARCIESSVVLCSKLTSSPTLGGKERKVRFISIMRRRDQGTIKWGVRGVKFGFNKCFQNCWPDWGTQYLQTIGRFKFFRWFFFFSKILKIHCSCGRFLSRGGSPTTSLCLPREASFIGFHSIWRQWKWFHLRWKLCSDVLLFE